MSDWLDIVSFVAILVLFVGVVTGAIYAAKAISNTIDETKKSLNEKGVNVSSSGVSVKTNKHLTREDYLDATQRNVVTAIRTSTTSAADPGGMYTQENRSQHHSPPIERSPSTTGSNRSVGSAKKKSSLFSIRKSTSRHSNHSA